MVEKKQSPIFLFRNEKEMDFSSGRMAKMPTCFRSIFVTLCQENGLQRIPGVYLQLPALHCRSDRMWRNTPSTSCIEAIAWKNIQLNPSKHRLKTCVPANRGTYAHFFVWIWQFWAGGTGVSTSVAAAWHGCGGNHGTAPDGIE